MSLAKSGLYGGNPYTVLNCPVDIVIKSYHFNEFTKVLEDTCIELNKG